MNPAWNAPVPLLVRRTGVDLEFVVANPALDISAELIATEFAARMPVENAHFPAVINRIQRRRHHLSG